MATKNSTETRTLAERLPELAEWCRLAKAHGRVYYNIERVSRSGMSRKITLWTIRTTERGPELVNAWCDRNGTEDPKAARRVNWSSRHRCFSVGGCGMDMVFALLYDLFPALGVEYIQTGAGSVRHESLSRYE